MPPQYEPRRHTLKMPNIIILDKLGAPRIYYGAEEVELNTTTQGEKAIYKSGYAKLDAISILSPPYITQYDDGDTFNPDGMVISAIYTNGASRAISDYSYSPRILSKGDTEVIITYTENDITKTARQPVSVSPSFHIYGVEWDGGSSPSWSRTDDSANFVDPVPYVSGSINYGSPFDGLMPWNGMHIIEDAQAGTLVSIPKFWYKFTQIGDGLKLQISDGPVDGFHISPAHMDRGDGNGERNVVYVGRYHCNANYKSISGQMPKINMSRSTSRSSISAIGSEFWQWDWSMRVTIQMLYLVEFATFDSQSKIGLGGGNGSGPEVVGYTDAMPYHTGTMKSSVTTGGVGTQYRYIEGLWENVRDWVDGCRYDSSIRLYVITNPSAFSDTTGGTLVGQLQTSGGFPTKISISANVDWCMYPSVLGGSSSKTYLCDFWASVSGYYCLSSGGSYIDSREEYFSRYGIFYISCAETTSLGDGEVGCRIMKLPNNT